MTQTIEFRNPKPSLRQQLIRYGVRRLNDDIEEQWRLMGGGGHGAGFFLYYSLTFQFEYIAIDVWSY